MRIAAATLALRLCTCPFMGMVIISSTCFLRLAEIPLPSLPIIRANLPAVFHLVDRVPFISVPKIQKPALFSLSKTCLKLVTRAIGTCSTAPVEVLATTGVTPTARCFGIMTPVTFVASAVRKIEPKLCGSVRPSKMSNRGFYS